MEPLQALPDDSSGANPSSVKSDGSSPRHDGGRGSPPPNCAICLGTCRNKSFTDSCLHQFCFKCLLTWSKVKAECPLCKQNFKSIIHNVRSNHQYEEYMVEQQQTDRTDVDNLRTLTRRFRYSTTFTVPRHDSLAIEHLLMHYPLMGGVFPPPPHRRRSPASFRRTVYRHNLWARPLPDFTGRFRDSTPNFYRNNDTQMHRLVPWLNRELSYLLNDNVGHISYVMARIMDLLPQYHITSPEFREAMRRYFGDRSEHFLHELYCFASTPYDMTGYDRNVQYTTDSRISTMVNEVISSSESEASVDSDIVMVSSSEPAEPPAGPSGLPPPAPAPADNVISIETISHSDTDDDSSEVMVVGFIKPPQERTPEVVDLLGSDSDVVVQESRAEPPTPLEPLNGREEPDGSYVKFTLKRQHPCSNSEESDDSDASYRPPASRRRRRPHSGGSSSTVDTRAAWPPTPPAPLTPPASLATPASPPPRAPSTSSDTAYTSSSSESYDCSDDMSDSDDRRPKYARRKPKRRNARDAPPRERKRRDKRTSRNRRVERKYVQEERIDRRVGPEERFDRRTILEDRVERNTVPEENVDKDRRNKRKSHSGKGVKSSKRRDESTSARGTERVAEGVEVAQAGPSGCRRRRERRPARLRSVVTVMPGAGPAAGPSAAWPTPPAPAHSSSDSEDNLPLNLTVQKAHPVS